MNTNYFRKSNIPISKYWREKLTRRLRAYKIESHVSTTWCVRYFWRNTQTPKLSVYATKKVSDNLGAFQSLCGEKCSQLMCTCRPDDIDGFKNLTFDTSRNLLISTTLRVALATKLKSLDDCSYPVQFLHNRCNLNIKLKFPQVHSPAAMTLVFWSSP